MTDGLMFVIAVVLLSLGGWYVLLGKYYTLKSQLDTVKAQQNKSHVYDDKKVHDVPIHKGLSLNKAGSSVLALLHLSGAVLLLSGVPFLNVLIPAMLWLWLQEQRPELTEHGKTVLNWQITVACLQCLSLILGVLFVSIFPGIAIKMLTWTKTIRLIFTSAVHIPGNIFSMPVLVYSIVLSIRGAIASYRGEEFRYSVMWRFIAVDASLAQAMQDVALRSAKPQSSAMNKIHQNFNFG